MAGVNKVILIGNLGKDPEIMTFDNGVKKASFTLATTEYFKNKEGNLTEHVEWHNIALWRNQADIAEKYLKKGSPVYIEGRIRSRTYEQDGVKKYFYEIMGDTMNMLGKRDSGDGGNQQQQSAPQSPPEEPEIEAPDDDLPF
ncbi:MAG: single-stranded DNA-binding protein [Bacteroidales bacterium]|nr:single-stranded DNA-binding protein [Bacteroidales bacterium]